MHDETWAKPLETSRSRSRSREMRKIWTKLSRIGILGGGGTGDKRSQWEEIDTISSIGKIF